MKKLDKVYRNEILLESKDPYHYEKVPEAINKVRAYNPLCGDRFDLFMADETIYFHGFGCTISKASTSLMIKALEGKSEEEMKTLIDRFISNIDLKEEIHEESLKVFQPHDNFKGRKDCILLSWKALRDIL